MEESTENTFKLIDMFGNYTFWITALLLGAFSFLVFNKNIRENILKSPVFIYSIIFTLITSVILTLNSKSVLIPLSENEPFYLGLFLTALAVLFELFYKYNIKKDEITSLKSELTEAKLKHSLLESIESTEKPIHLQKYSGKKTINSLLWVKNNLKGLTGNGFKGTVNDKIEILEEVLRYEAYNQEGKIKKFYATTLNKPSQMWDSFEKLWKLQTDTMDEIQDKNLKVRVVVISPKELNDEIQEHSKSLKEFIKWHDVNGFTLKFILETSNEFKKEIKEFLNRDTDEYMNDFAIINDSIVYGEEIETGLIKLIQKNTHEGEDDDNTIKDYDYFYQHLLEKRFTRLRWHERSPVQILAECERILDKQNYSVKSLLKHYNNLITDENQFKAKVGNSLWQNLNASTDIIGDDYLIYLSNLLTETVGQGDELLALDLTPSKRRFLDWIHVDNYREWMDTTISLANKGCNCSRIFIVNEVAVDKTSIDIVINKILIPQLEANITLYLVSEYELFMKDLPYFDVLLVKGKICHSLNIGQTFVNDSDKDKKGDTDVSIKANLEHENCFCRYELAYNNIINSNLESIVKLDNSLVAKPEDLKNIVHDFFENKIYINEKLKN